MDNLGMHEANDQTAAGGNDQGKNASERKEPSSPEPQPLQDGGNDVGKPPGTSYPLEGA